MQIPIAFRNDNNISTTVLAGDVGGTKTNIALYEVDKGVFTLQREKRYASKDYRSLEDIIHDFSGDTLPDRICVAVAGPVIKGKSKLTNLSWTLDNEALGASLQRPIAFINDLEATAYGLAGLKDNERALIAPGDPGAEGNIAILAPGTGLGEAGLYWDGQAYHPFATEGGHSDFAPRTDEVFVFFFFFRLFFGFVCWVCVVFGLG